MFLIGLVIITLCFAARDGVAQTKADPGQFLFPPAPLTEPANADGSRCFSVWNKAPYTITGTVNTNYYETASGAKARRNQNFRLAPGARQGLCSTGPFYPGARLELVLRSLVPLFSCYTVAQGEIMIHGEIKPEGGTKTWAACQ